MITFKNFRLNLNEELKKIADKKGSNPGGVYRDTDSNKKFYMKFYDDPDQAKSEVLSAKIHDYLGGNTLSPRYVVHNGQHGIQTDWMDNLHNINPNTPLNDKQKTQIAKLYHGSVLTKNWDLVGLEYDNLAINKDTGNVHLQDPGGSFNFRAMGGRKDYDPEIGEYHTLRDPYKNYESHALLKHALGNDNSITKAAYKPLTDEDHKAIYNMFATSGISNWQDLHKNFVARSKKLDKMYPDTVNEAKKNICWKGYKRKAGTKPYEKGSCVKEESLKLGGDVSASKRMIDDVYSKYPAHPFNASQRAMVDGEGDDQTLGTFELKPSMSAKNAVELAWLSAYPHKQGVGSRTLKKLQDHATEHGVGITLFPWSRGGVSQSKLMKFYGKHGFVPTTKGGKAMIWRPDIKEEIEDLDEATYQGREVPLNKKMRGDVKKFKVYVDPDKDGKATKVNFGDPNMRIKKSNPKNRKNFRARHRCATPGPKDKPRYWSCRNW